ncbi:MAG: PHP domain-containing protein, partial [Actinobacteria bacterium]|nr:PHP domain-containing protein [Actinomycetota bacterium]
MSNFKYPKGSEWRKWDLHFHTPSSFDYKDKSIKNELIINRLLDDKIKVIAITDHHKIDVGRLENIQILAKIQEITVFPGIELATDKGGSESIHIIGIFQEDIDIETIWTKISGQLNITEKDIQKKGDNRIYVPLEVSANLIHELGGLVTIHAGSKSNTIENITNSLSYKMAQKEDILKYIDIFEMGKSADIDDYLVNVIPNISHIKRPPMIVCSDNHDIKDYSLKSNLWVKGDPTFEGLKQIICEPDERVYIGEEPPYKIERNKIIKSITISNSNKWFGDKPIRLNEGLISIVGGKGTGKTAILDLIAYVTGSYKCFEKVESKSKSFLKKAFRELKGSKIKIEWDEGNPDEMEIGSILEEFTKEGKVRYLPQDYVDQLCTEIGKSELEEQIENVVFQKIPSENKATFTDFKNYKETQLKTISEKKHRIVEQIEKTNFKIYEQEKIIKSKSIKNEEIRKINNEIEKFNQEMKKISDALGASNDQKKILDELNFSMEQKSDLEKIISELKTKILKIEEVKNEISVFLENSNTFANKLKADLYGVGIKEEDIKKVKVVLRPENLNQILDTRKKKIDDETKKQKSELDNLDKKFKDLNSKIKLEKSKQDKINEINKSLSDLKKKKDALGSDVKKIEDAEKELPQLLNNRESVFINYFELIFEEKEKLKEIYSPLEKILKESGEENERLFDFTVKFNFDVNSMA